VRFKLLLLFTVLVGCIGGAFNVSGQTLQSVKLGWEASPSFNVIAYTIRYGLASGTYSYLTNVGNQLIGTVNDLQPGSRYFFAVTAMDSSGNESLPSGEVSYDVPAIPLLPPSITLSSPIEGDSYVAPADVTLAASVLDNGHTISKVQFYNGTNWVGEADAPPYSLVWSNVPSGDYVVLGRLVYDSGSTVDSDPTSLSVTMVGPPWQTLDIGNVGVEGSVTQANDAFTITGAGRIAGTRDQFQFVYQTLSADGQIQAQVQSAAGDLTNNCSGLMIRENLATGSRYALVGVGQNLALRWQRRANTWGNSFGTTSGTAAPPNCWIRLTRTGSNISGYKSADGTNWTRIAGRNFNMATNAYVGMVVASGNTNAATTSAFSNVSVSP